MQRDPDSRHSVHLSYRVRRDIVTAETAGEIMSTALVTVRPGATVAEAARLMDRHDVTFLPVTDESGKLLGVIRPRNLLRVFLRPDEEIRAEISNDVLAGYLGTNPALVHVEGNDGVVSLAGELERKSMLALIVPAVRAGQRGHRRRGRTPLRGRRHGVPPGPERDESPLTRGIHPPVASRRLT